MISSGSDELARQLAQVQLCCQELEASTASLTAQLEASSSQISRLQSDNTNVRLILYLACATTRSAVTTRSEVQCGSVKLAVCLKACLSLARRCCRIFFIECMRLVLPGDTGDSLAPVSTARNNP